MRRTIVASSIAPLAHWAGVRRRMATVHRRSAEALTRFGRDIAGTALDERLGAVTGRE